MQRYTIIETGGGSYEVIVGHGIIAKSIIEMPDAPDGPVRLAHTYFVAAKVAGKTTATFETWLDTFDHAELLESGESPEPSAT